jgi:hypothetical protein
MGRGSSGPRIVSRWERDFLHPSRPALGPTQPPAQWVPVVLPGGVYGGWGVALTTHPHLVPEVKKQQNLPLLPPEPS